MQLQLWMNTLELSVHKDSKLNRFVSINSGGATAIFTVFIGFNRLYI